MADWTLTHDGVTKTLAAWGMTACVISEPSFNAGTFTASIPGAMTDTLPWAYGDKVTISLGATVKFRGIVLDPICSGSGTEEQIDFRAVDPWWWFGQGGFTSLWWKAESEAAYESSKASVFANVTPGTGWAPRTVGAELVAIINHCNTQHGGGVMQVGTVTGPGFGIMPVPERVENMTHEAVLRRVLQWVPDAIPSWDHSTDPPSLNFTQRASATARNYEFCEGRVMASQNITKRSDKIVRGVELTYKYIDALGTPVTATDSAGASTGDGVLRATIDLSGGAGGSPPAAPSVTPGLTQKYNVVSDPVLYSEKAWWFKYGDLGIESEDEIKSVEGPPRFEFAEDAPENAGKSGLGGCDRQWLSGGIPQSRENANTRMAEVYAKLMIETTTADPEDESLTMTTKEWRQVLLTMPVTKLSGEYTIVIQDETVSYPAGITGIWAVLGISGIAAQLLAAWSQPQYSGALRVTRAECNEAVRLGDVVNWTAGNTEWATMRAQVQQITRSIDSGTTDIVLGVAEHLGLDEFASLMQIGRGMPALDINQQATDPTPTGEGGLTEEEQLVHPSSVRSSTRVALKSIHCYSPTEEFILQQLNGEEEEP